MKWWNIKVNIFANLPCPLQSHISPGAWNLPVLEQIHVWLPTKPLQGEAECLIPHWADKHALLCSPQWVWETPKTGAVIEQKVLWQLSQRFCSDCDFIYLFCFVFPFLPLSSILRKLNTKWISFKENYERNIYYLKHCCRGNSAKFSVVKFVPADITFSSVLSPSFLSKYLYQSLFTLCDFWQDILSENFEFSFIGFLYFSTVVIHSMSTLVLCICNINHSLKCHGLYCFPHSGLFAWSGRRLELRCRTLDVCSSGGRLWV